MHLSRLTGGRQHTAPEPPLWVDLFPLPSGQIDRDICELIVPCPHHHVGPAGHTCVDSVMPQKQSKGRIMGICGLASDDIARINVLKVNFCTCYGKFHLDGVPQPDADVAKLYVARAIVLPSSR